MPLAADFLGRSPAVATNEINTRPLTLSGPWLMVEFRHTLQLFDPRNNRFCDGGPPKPWLGFK
jgi:hypothetical protein